LFFLKCLGSITSIGGMAEYSSSPTLRSMPIDGGFGATT